MWGYIGSPCFSAWRLIKSQSAFLWQIGEPCIKTWPRTWRRGGDISPPKYCISGSFTEPGPTTHTSLFFPWKDWWAKALGAVTVSMAGDTISKPCLVCSTLSCGALQGSSALLPTLYKGGNWGMEHSRGLSKVSSADLHALRNKLSKKCKVRQIHLASRWSPKHSVPFFFPASPIPCPPHPVTHVGRAVASLLFHKNYYTVKERCKVRLMKKGTWQGCLF